MTGSFFTIDNFGALVRQHRKAKGIQMQELAPLLGVSIATLSSCENKNIVLPAKSILKLEEILGIKVFWMVCQSEEDYRRFMGLVDFEKAHEDFKNKNKKK